MSLSEETRQTPRYSPSKDSLCMALDLAKADEKNWTAEDVMVAAAQFDAYLLGDLIVPLRVNNGPSNLNRTHSLDNSLRSRFEVSDNVILSNEPSVGFVLSGVKDDLEQSEDKTLFGRSTHNDTPSSDETHPTDSSSEGRDESVADQSRPEASYPNRIKAAAALAELLPQSALNGLVAGEPNAATDALLHEAAANELQRRRGA